MAARLPGRPLLLIFGVYAGFALWLLAATHLEHYLSDLNLDDSFYYLTIARHLAHGAGSTFDGIHPTNGYHPLWGFLLVPFLAVIHDPEWVLRAVKGFELVLLGGASLLFLRAGARSGLSPALLALPPLVWLGLRPLYDGMESALHFSVLAAALAAWVHLHSRPASDRAWIVLGCCASLLAWARLESALIGLAIVPTAWWSVGGRLSDSERPRARRAAGAAALLPVTSLGVYFVYNQLGFGSIYPVSGAFKRFYSLRYFEREGGYRFLPNLLGILSISKVWQGGAMTLLAAGLFLRDRGGTTPARRDPWLLFALLLGSGHVAYAGYATLFLHPGYAGYSHYFIPMTLLGGMVFASAGSRLASRAPGRLRTGWRGRVLPVLLGAGILGNFLIETVRWYSRGGPSWESELHQGTLWINDNLPPAGVVGAASAGVMGYFAVPRVVNLDGLVNSREYLEAVRRGEGSAWVRATGVTYVAGMFITRADEGCAGVDATLWQIAPLSGACPRIHEGERELELGGGRRRFRVYSISETP